MGTTRFADLDLAGWQSVLDRHSAIFLGMCGGSRIGVMSKDDFEPPDATMLVWEAAANTMRAKYERFPGFDRVEIDLMFIADEATLARLHDSANTNPFAVIRSKVRRRDILLYVVRPRQELLDRGYSEFLDSLGLVFMGTCR
jgi:hypothetical protein